MIIHLGVVDIPYASPPETNDKGYRKSGTQTTGDVAEWLEEKYHVMENFADHDMDNISASVANSLAGSLETYMQSGRMPKDPFAGGMQKIEASFRDFLDKEVIATLGVQGVPTGAALKGVNHRKKSKKGKRRPSFIDTGLYQKSFKAWT